MLVDCGRLTLMEQERCRTLDDEKRTVLELKETRASISSLGRVADTREPNPRRIEPPEAIEPNRAGTMPAINASTAGLRVFVGASSVERSNLDAVALPLRTFIPYLIVNISNFFAYWH